MKRIVGKTEDKQTYFISFYVDARYYTEVEASSVEEAKKLALESWWDCNIGDLSVMESELNSIETEDGDFVYER